MHQPCEEVNTSIYPLSTMCSCYFRRGWFKNGGGLSEWGVQQH